MARLGEEGKKNNYKDKEEEVLVTCSNVEVLRRISTFASLKKEHNCRSNQEEFCVLGREARLHSQLSSNSSVGSFSFFWSCQAVAAVVQGRTRRRYPESYKSKPLESRTCTGRSTGSRDNQGAAQIL